MDEYEDESSIFGERSFIADEEDGIWFLGALWPWDEETLEAAALAQAWMEYRRSQEAQEAEEATDDEDSSDEKETDEK